MFLASCSVASNMPVDQLTVPGEYELVWADEFAYEGLPDPERWDYDTYRNAEGWWNDELQYYAASRPKNARVENGHLIIEVHRELLNEEDYPDWGGQNYTSTRLLTRDIAAWKYGYIEVRAKLPCGKGLWPAIWTLPEGRSRWPDDGEIDIMEYVGHDPNRFHATVHTRGSNHTKGQHFGAGFWSRTACGGFHTHSLHWTPDRILIAVDGKPYFHYPKEDKRYRYWPFDRPHHLILNIAVGGWGGRKGIDPEAFPARMEVDYVRVYQRSDDR